MPDLCFIAARAALKILIFPLGVLEVEQGLITLSIPLSAQELDRSKPAPVSKKGCKLECPEENLRIYSRAMKSTKCHPWNRVLMEKHSRIPVSLPQPPGNHRALDNSCSPGLGHFFRSEYQAWPPDAFLRCSCVIEK